MTPTSNTHPSSKTKMPKYIAIEGCIGVGKTALSRALAPRFNAEQLLEKFEENPFLPDFYKDPTVNAFKTQIFFLLSRYKQQLALEQQDLFSQAIVADYLLAKDKIFAELTLQGSEFALYDQLYATLFQHLVVPDLLIYLRAPLPVIMQRIQKRDRTFERDIDPAYLEKLSDAYDRFFANFSLCPVLTIETEDFNFPDKDEHVSLVVDAISETLQQNKSAHLVSAGSKIQPTLFA